VKTATIEFLKIELEKDGILFRGSIPDDGNSFFKACSDQLQHLPNLIFTFKHKTLSQYISI
jgi:hypothetical protein